MSVIVQTVPFVAVNDHCLLCVSSIEGGLDIEFDFFADSKTSLKEVDSLSFNELGVFEYKEFVTPEIFILAPASV